MRLLLALTIKDHKCKTKNQLMKNLLNLVGNWEKKQKDVLTWIFKWSKNQLFFTSQFFLLKSLFQGLKALELTIDLAWQISFILWYKFFFLQFFYFYSWIFWIQMIQNLAVFNQVSKISVRFIYKIDFFGKLHKIPHYDSIICSEGFKAVNI